MATGRKVRDPALLDALESLKPVIFEGVVWRVVREGRDPRQCSNAGGRWDDGTFNVLYTSTMADGAIAEMHFHLSRGQPVFPSKIRYCLHELRAALKQALELVDLMALDSLGIDTARYGQLSYAERQQEYPRSQEIAETAYFLGFDGLMVPCARWECLNVVLFCDQVQPESYGVALSHGTVDWKVWQQVPKNF